MKTITEFIQVGSDAKIQLDEDYYQGLLTRPPNESGYVAYAIGATPANEYTGSELTFGYIDASLAFVAVFGIGADLVPIDPGSRHFFIWDYLRGGPAILIDVLGRVGIHLPAYEEPKAFLDVRGSISCQESLALPTKTDAEATEGLFFGADHDGKLCRKKGETVVEIG